MPPLMPIGEFSRATRLTAKALRFYHHVGLLEPALVDDVTRYRSYSPAQIDDARVIHHLRSLDMPIDEIRVVLTAQDPGERHRVISGHLDRMQELLTTAQASIGALRELLSPAPAPVEVRHVPAGRALVVRAVIDLEDLGSWFLETRDELTEVLASHCLEPAGPLGGLWSTELFLVEHGECALFLPVADGVDLVSHGPAQVETLPASVLAVVTHRGADETIGQAYATLGTYVAEAGVGVPGPVRETYLDGAPTERGTTEIGWPVDDHAIITTRDAPARQHEARRS